MRSVRPRQIGSTAKENEEGHAFVRCLLVACDLKPPPVEPKKALSAYAAGIRRASMLADMPTPDERHKLVHTKWRNAFFLELIPTIAVWYHDKLFILNNLLGGVVAQLPHPRLRSELPDSFSRYGGMLVRHENGVVGEDA